MSLLLELRDKTKTEIQNYAYNLGIHLNVGGTEKTKNALIRNIENMIATHRGFIHTDWRQRIDAGRSPWIFDPTNHRYTKTQLLVFARGLHLPTRGKSRAQLITIVRQGIRHLEAIDEDEEKDEDEIRAYHPRVIRHDVANVASVILRRVPVNVDVIQFLISQAQALSGIHDHEGTVVVRTITATARVVGLDDYGRVKSD